MYFPYLHGMQAELQALAEASPDMGKPQQIIPVIEPVRANAAKLRRTLDVFKTNSAAAYLVLNPVQGDFASPAAVATWAASLSTELADPTLVRPTLLENNATTLAEITTFATAHAGRKLALVLVTDRFTATEIATAIGSADVLIFLKASASASTLTPAVPASRIVEVHDAFNTQARNADYTGQEFFTAGHLTYSAAGQAGFSDHTALPGRYVSGGGPVGAAAIHLTFQDASTNQFWVQHFVSDETDRTVGTPSSKLLEAIEHVHTQVATTPGRFSSSSPGIAAFMAQRAAGRPTNLAKSKQLQVQHHLDLVARHLGI